MSRQRVAYTALLVAVFALIFGAKLRLIDRYGSDVPYWDQWDAEGENLYQAQAEGTLSAQNFFRPHNEHRPVFTRILALGLFDLDDREWDPLLEQVVDALIHISLALVLLAFASRLLPPALLLGFAALTTVFFSTNVSWENTLSGFQSQFYFLALFSVLHLAGTLGTRPRSRAWWLAPFAGVATLFCMASGLLSALSILAITGLRIARDRKFTRDDLYIVIANVGLVVAGWLLKVEVPDHAVLKAAGLSGWLDAWIHQLAWPITTQVAYWVALGLLPPLAMLVAFLRRRIDGPAALVLLAACAWVVMQTMAIAYARGGAEHGYSSRYTDNLALGVLINVLAVAYLAIGIKSSRVRAALGAGCATMVIASLSGLHREATAVRDGTLEPMIAIQSARATTVRAYLATHGAQFFNKIPWDELPYPSAARLADLLDRPAIRASLPAEVRPSIPLQPATLSQTTSFRAETRFRPGPIPGPTPLDLPYWVGKSAEPAEFQSELFYARHSRLSLYIAAGPDTGALELRLRSARGEIVEPRQEKFPHDLHWHRINFPITPGNYQLSVRIPGGGEVLFTNPVTDTPLARVTADFVHSGNLMTGGGIIAAALALGLLVNPRSARGGLTKSGALIGTRWSSIKDNLAWGKISPPVKTILSIGLAALLTLLLWRPEPEEITFVETLANFCVTGSLLFLFWLPIAARLERHPAIPAHWVPLVASAAVAFIGYTLFWVYYFSPAAGKAATVLLFLAAAASTLKGVGSSRAAFWTVPKLQAAIGAMYIAAIFIYTAPGDFYAVTSTRIIPGLPSDNELPHELAARIYENANLQPFVGDWRASDRPPLEAAWQLITWPVADWLKLSTTTTSGTAGMWLQLTWVSAAFGLLCELGVAARSAALWTLAMALAGFFLVNTAFIWPKLSAGAFTCGAFALWVLPPRATPYSLVRIVVGAFLAGLAWLSHGGVAFSLLPVVPWIGWKMVRGEWRPWLAAAGVVAALWLPWSIYQRVVDPPGDRLLKWHLAGQVPVTSQGLIETLEKNYGGLSSAEIVANKKYNFYTQFPHPWSPLWNFSSRFAEERRREQFYYTAGALSWWAYGAGAVLLALTQRSARQRLRHHGRSHVIVVAWLMASIACWCLLLFGGESVAIVHQGSYAIMIAAFAVLSAWFEVASFWFILPVAALQSITLATAYLGSKRALGEPDQLHLLPSAFAVLSLAAAFAYFWRRDSTTLPEAHALPLY